MFPATSGRAQAEILGMILHQQEHFFDVGQSKLLFPRSLILTEGLKLAGSYAIGLNRVRFRQEVACRITAKLRVRPGAFKE